MATLLTRIEELVSTYNRKAPCALHEIEDQYANSIFIGLRTLSQGFYVYTIHPDEVRRYVTIKSETTERSGPTKYLDSVINRCIKLNVECLYDTGMRTNYSAKPSEFNNVHGAFVSSDLINQDVFLRRFFETDELAGAYQIDPIKQIKESGVDATEQFETFSRSLDEREALKEGKDLDNLEHSAEFYDNEDDEFE